MSRTRKGSRGPGWEPWSNKNERQKPAPDPDAGRWSDQDLLLGEEAQDNWLCYLNGGCSRCEGSR